MAARLLAPGVVLLVLVAAACGAEAVPPDDVVAAGTTTKAVGSARSETIVRISAGEVESREFRWTAIVDYEGDRSTTVEEASGCRTIAIGELSYSELPPGEGMPEGKRWVASGHEADDGERLFEESQEQETSAGDSTTWVSDVGVALRDPAPDEYLDYLRASSGEPERVGEEIVRGVPTTRYRATLDVRRTMRKALEEDGWKQANIERYLETMVETGEEIDVWVDAHGLARRLVRTTEPDRAELRMRHRTVTTTEYFDFGVEAAIEPPAASEVIDSSEWQRISERQLSEQLDDAGELEEGITSLPGGFEPTVDNPWRRGCRS